MRHPNLQEPTLVEPFRNSFEAAIFFDLNLTSTRRGRVLLETPED